MTPAAPDGLAARVLAILARDTGRTDTDLAALLGITTAGLSPVIARLYRQGRADRCGPYLVAAPPAPGKSGTSGTCGTRPGQTPHPGFPRPGQVPERPEPPAPALPLPATGSPGQGDEATTADTPQETAMTTSSPLAGLPDPAPGQETARGHRLGGPGHHRPGPHHRLLGPRPLQHRHRHRPGRPGRARPGQAQARPGAPAQWALPGITDGADVLAALCERHGQPWPGDTFTVRTGRGGLHLYFTAPPGLALPNTAGAAGRGLGWLIDTRARGGYVVAPGSIVDTEAGPARYEVACDRPPAPLPDWLTVLLTAPPAENPPPECRTTAPDQLRDLNRYAATALSRESERVHTAAEGGRNHALNKAAYHLGQLIAAGALPEHLACDELHDAASVHFGVGSPPFTAEYARSVIVAGITAGKRKPRPLPTLGAAA